MKDTRVVILPPGPPEALAFALARYSRSADSIEKSLEWVFDHSEEKFWETFYFEYNHKSIADLGHVSMCFENISELAAQYLLDEQLWNGQAKSTRYQDFSSVGYFIPKDASPNYEDIINNAINFYKEFTKLVLVKIKEENPKPDDMKQQAYERNMHARTFDISRYVLPLAMNTCLGQVVSIRTLERQANKLLGSNKEELQQIGKQIAEACSNRPDICREDGIDFPEHKIMAVNDAIAPTLARHIKPDTWGNDWKQKIALFLDEIDLNWLRDFDDQLLKIKNTEFVELWAGIDGAREIVATILFSQFETLSFKTAIEYAEIIDMYDKTQAFFDMLLEGRGEHDLLPRQFRSGYEFIFEIQCDIGAWRDLHRHRRCQQIWSEFTPLLGFSIPAPLNKEGWQHLKKMYVNYMSELFTIIKTMEKKEQQYLLPMATITKSLFKMDFAEVEYIAKLRSGVKGHFSYRKIACEMKELIEVEYPELSNLIKVTPLEEEDLLKR